MISKKIYDIHREPSGDVYKHLVNFCAKYAKTGLLVGNIVKGYPSQKTTREFLINNGGWIIKSSKWPGTQLGGAATAEIIYFSLTPQILEFLKTRVRRLYQWQGDLNELDDLCFIREDGEEILCTIAHEDDSYLILSIEELLELQKDKYLFENLVISQHKD